VADAEVPVERGQTLDRLVAFSDGVFAIAMTLLVLSLTIPDLHGSESSINEKLWETFREQAPELWSYTLSFAVIGRYWLVHHRLFGLVRRADTRLLVLNLFLLGCIAVIPYPTEILGRYGDTTAGVVIYSATLTVTGIANLLVTRHIDAAGLLDERATAKYRQHAHLRSATLPIIFGLSIPIAFVDPALAMVSWAVTSVALTVFGTRRYGKINDPFDG
jgi:uncharacterized membrane protein